MAKRAEKIKFDRYPHINLVPFVLETTGRPSHHAKKCISSLMKDADQPSLAIRDTRTSQRHFQTTTHSSSHVTPSTHYLPPIFHLGFSFDTLAALRSLCLSLHTPPCLTTLVWPVAMRFSGVAFLVVVIVADHSSLARIAGRRTRCPVVHLAWLFSAHLRPDSAGR